MSQRVVLIHGIFNSGYVFHAFRRRLESQGFECFAPSLKPRDGRDGIDDWAIKLKREIDSEFGEHTPIILVGFSMGGIVARYYLQKLGGYKRVSSLFTISSPHRGSYLAYFYLGKGTRQLRPNSEFLNELRLEEDKYDGIPVFSYWTPFDLMIIPATSSIWPIAENKRFYSVLHILMLFNRGLIDTISRTIVELSSVTSVERK